MKTRYTTVATMRPFSNIFDSCRNGPIRNIVLHSDRAHTHSSLSKHIASSRHTTLCCKNCRHEMRLLLAHLLIIRTLDSVYSTAKRAGKRKKNDACR